MPHTTTAAPAPTRATAWDRIAIALLGLAGFALSYDALRQTAAAAHIREPLTYLFPLIVDGFIAYGVRALIVLGRAPLAARAYAWALFAAATTASIWANVLHAVRLNQQNPDHDRNGLRLGDGVVGVLSALAPLALAGAVHLYTLIARGSDDSGPADAPNAIPHDATSADPADRTDRAGVKDAWPIRTITALPQLVTAPGEHSTIEHSRPSEPPTVVDAPERNPQRPQFPQDALPPAAALPVSRRPPGRPPAADIDTHVTSPRAAVEQAGRSNREIVTAAIRARGLTIGGKRLTHIMRRLRAEQDLAAPAQDH
jgi:hypothetical protein